MREFKILLTLGAIFLTTFCLAQKVIIEGYVFEDGNRGFLNVAEVTILNKATNALVTKAITNRNGVFIAEVDSGKEYILRTSKKVFEKSETVVSTVDKSAGETVYVKIRMKRAPGYRFEVTMAEKRIKDEPVNAIEGAAVEVYNNTMDTIEMNLQNHPMPTFALNFEQGNHYTIMVRKKGFFVKRMEAYVNVSGCILCFDGVGEVTPGVSEALTEANQQGTLLANIELIPIKMNESIEIENIYYETNQSRIRTATKTELDKLVTVLKDNSSLLIEIGSHTDSNGDDDLNQNLSNRRAKKVVDYLIEKGIHTSRLIAKGYGENKLVNKCKNGVTCSEDQHAKNRRTELKVVGYINEAIVSEKSLFDIKEEEKFEKMLAEIQNTEAIKIEEGGELPDEIKKEMEAQAKPRQNEQKATKEPSEESAMQLEIDQPIQPQRKPQTSPVEPPVVDYTPKPEKVVPPKKKTKASKPSKISGSTNYRIKKEPVVRETTTPVTEKMEETKVKVEKKKSQTITMSPKVNDDENFGVDFTEEDKAVFNSSENNRNQGEFKISTDINYSGANEMKTEYTGYKVEFFTSPYELPASHEIFSRHGNIVQEERKDGSYAYLLGDFNDQDNANSFLNSIMKERYPAARVIQFNNGRRLN